jgi:hypothetical protein
MIKKFNEFDKINEDQELKRLSGLKELAERAIQLNKELIEISDEAAVVKGYKNWEDLSDDQGYTDEVNLFDQSMPKSNIRDLESFLSNYYEDYKKDKIVDLHRMRKEDQPNLPG